MEKTKNFIYENIFEAFSYFIQFIFSIVVPTAISLFKDEHLFFVVIILINSISLLREYFLLYKFKKTSRRFWIERFIGISVVVIIFAYSLLALLFFINGTTGFIFKVLDIICAVLFLIPGIFSLIESIIYIKTDYKENVVNETFVVAGKNSQNV